jgi:CheY-like chemotaxis protein
MGDDRDARGTDSGVLAERKALHGQILARLSAARFPIQDDEEMRRAFGSRAMFEIGGIPVSAEALVGLLTAWDYVFTNPHQVANLLAQRAMAAYSPGRLQAFALAHVGGSVSRRPDVVGTPREGEETSAHLLAIDDDPSVRRLLQFVLTEEGYRVTTASDGPSAIASAEKDPPDLVILDFSMPGMGGAEVLRALKRRRPSLPVFFLTVYGDFPEKTELTEADCCFVKSSNLTPMIEAIARTLIGPDHSSPPCPDRV